MTNVVWMFLGVSIAAAVIVTISNVRLHITNKKLKELLKENYEVGKTLVRRDIELTEANLRLMALDESKSEFASVMAHQLRTPLTGIRWAFEELLSREEQLIREHKKTIIGGLNSTKRMIELVNDFLNTARIEEGRFGLELARKPFAPILSEIINRMERPALERSVKIIRSFEDNLPELNVDEEKIGIALENVLDNAVKYTPSGGEVKVAAKVTGKNLSIEISDTGIGIPKDQMNHIFDKFFRAENAVRQETAGNGLGLYVVKNIIEGHGGTIYLSSVEGSETKVSIILPL
ncbi:MAG: ATP-binding protein [Parcubacteria group bacterium]